MDVTGNLLYLLQDENITEELRQNSHLTGPGAHLGTIQRLQGKSCTGRKDS